MDYSFFDFLRLIGSLALFLYGMKIMSEGLQKFAGDSFTANTNRDDHEQSNRYAHRGVNNGSYPIIIGYDGYGREFRECRTLRH